MGTRPFRARAGGAGAGKAAALLVLLVAALPCALVRGDAVVGKWASIVTDAMVQKRIGANAVRMCRTSCVRVDRGGKPSPA